MSTGEARCALVVSCGISLSLGLSSVARAEGDPDASSAGTPEARPAQTKPRLDDVRYVDAHCDHAIWGSTGETHPERTWFFSDFWLVMPRAGYAVTDRFEAMVTWVPTNWVDAAANWNVLRYGVLRTALNFGYTRSFHPPEFVVARQSAWRLGAAQQFCFSSECWSSVSLSALAFWDAHADFPTQDPHVIAFVSGVFALGRTVKLLIEPQVVQNWDYAFGVSNESFDATMGLSVGVRITGPHVAVDIGLVPIDTVEFWGPAPWIAFTYRTL
ncbi:MAG TPA: hypothetical protein VF103_07620 [Polyangiaceae bacterium]